MIPIHKTGKKVLNYCLISMKSQRLQWYMEPETINREKTTATFSQSLPKYKLAS